GAAILNVHQTKGLGPWAGLGVLTIYVLIVLAAGFVVTHTRDT
ncbi:MAG: hypothetical protein JWL83_1169, partial [Actinomycetia bacterium]|nr:hypothetical protein [Actinomycetes bacterium]